MTVAGAISSGARCQRRATKPAVGPVASQPASGKEPNPTLRKLGCQRWTRHMLLTLRRFANCRFQVERLVLDGECSGVIPNEFDAEKPTEERADLSAREKIMSYKYTGH